MGSVGWGELLIVLLIVLLLVGARRLPEIGRSVGQAIREFQRSFRGGSGDDKEDQGKV